MDTFGAIVITGLLTIAVGGIFIVAPGYGNCVAATNPFHDRSSETVMPNRFATPIGESPARTMYSCSTPTDPGGKVVETTGNVDCAGGIVAKSVGPTGTTVVALPLTSVPHEEMSMMRERMAPDAAIAVRFIDFISLNSRRICPQSMLTRQREYYASGRNEATIGDGSDVDPMRN